MTKKIFYEKVGRKYVPVYEYDQTLMDALPKGAHLIMCYPGGQSTRYNVDPNYAAMIAAGRLAEEEIARAMRMASELKSSKTPITVEQKNAWDKLKEAFGDDMYALQGTSARDLAEAGVNAMMIEAQELMLHPAVKKAYENFQIVAKLVSDSERRGVK